MSDGNGALPDGWEVASVEEFARTATGGTPSRKRDEYYGGDIPWVKSGDLNDGIVTTVGESITEVGLKNSNAKIFPKGAVCIALYGATVGKLGILDIDATTNQAVCGIFAEDGVDPKYVFYALRNERANLIGQAQGGAQPNISNGIIKTTRLRIAPEAEQRRIVSKIESLQERSSRARRALSEVGPLLEQFRQSVLRAAFSGRLTADWRAANPDVEPATELLNRIRTERRHRWEQSELAKYEAKGKQPPKNWQDKYKEPATSSVDEHPDLPDDWSWASLDEIAHTIVDCPHSTPKYGAGDCFAVDTTCISPDGVDIDKLRIVDRETFDARNRRLVPEPGDIVFAREGTVGTAVTLPDSPPVCLGQRVMLIRPHSDIQPTMVSFAIMSPFTVVQYSEKLTGSTVAHVNVRDVIRFAIPIPPADEQAVLVGRIKDAFESIRELENVVAESESALTQLDQSILAKAFRGELVPQDPRDEPASELLARMRTTREANQSKKSRKQTRLPKN